MALRRTNSFFFLLLTVYMDEVVKFYNLVTTKRIPCAKFGGHWLGFWLLILCFTLRKWESIIGKRSANGHALDFIGNFLVHHKGYNSKPSFPVASQLPSVVHAAYRNELVARQRFCSKDCPIWSTWAVVDPLRWCVLSFFIPFLSHTILEELLSNFSYSRTSFLILTMASVDPTFHSETCSVVARKFPRSRSQQLLSSSFFRTFFFSADQQHQSLQTKETLKVVEQFFRQWMKNFFRFFELNKIFTMNLGNIWWLALITSQICIIGFIYFNIHRCNSLQMPFFFKKWIQNILCIRYNGCECCRFLFLIISETFVLDCHIGNLFLRRCVHL